MLLKTYLASNTILTDEQANAISYLQTTGRDLVQNIMRVKYANRVMYVENESTLTADVQRAVQTVFSMHEYNWTHKHNTILLQYQPLIATEMNEVTKDTNSGQDANTQHDADGGTDTTTDSGSNTGTVSENMHASKNDNSMKSLRTYDDNTMTETENVLNTADDTNTNTTTNNLQNANTNTLQHGHTLDHTETETFGHVLDHTRSLTGRDNMTAQDLIMKEREVAEYNFYEMIADEVCDFITTLEYNFTDTE